MWAVIGLALVGLTVASLVFIVVYRIRATRDRATSSEESNRDEDSKRDAVDETNRGHRDVEEATTNDGRTEKRSDGDANPATTGKEIAFFGDASIIAETKKTDDKVAGGHDDDGFENEWLGGGDPWSDNEIASSELSMYMDEDYQANRGGPDWLHHGRARRSVASLAEGQQRRRGSPKRYAFADDYYRLLPPAVPQLPSDSEGYVYG